MSALLTLLIALSGFLLRAHGTSTIYSFTKTNPLPFSLYGAMIGYTSQQTSIVLLGGVVGTGTHDTYYVELNITNESSESAKLVAGSIANQSTFVMFDQRSTAINDGVYFLNVGKNKRNLSWEIFNVTSKTTTTILLSQTNYTVSSVTMCSDGKTIIYVSILGVEKNAKYFSQVFTYTVASNTWQNVTARLFGASLANYGSCAWRKSTNELFFFGGSDYTTGKPLSQIWSLNMAGPGHFKSRGYMIIPRMAAGAFVIKDAFAIENILVVGGCLQSNGVTCAISITNTEIYDLTQNATTGFGPHLSDPLAQFSAFFHKNTLWVVGGTSDNGNSNVVQYLDFSQKKWSQMLTSMTNVYNIYVVNNLTSGIPNGGYGTTSYEDAIEKAIWSYSGQTMSILFPGNWETLRNRQYHWYLTHNISVQLGCADVTSMCSIISHNSGLVALTVVDNVKISLKIYNISLTVNRQHPLTKESFGQFVSAMLNQAPYPNTTLRIVMTNIVFIGNGTDTYGLWITVGSGNNHMLMLSGVTIYDTVGPFLELQGNGPIWDVTLVDFTVNNHSGSSKTLCGDAVVCLWSVNNVYVTKWTVTDCVVNSSALVVETFGMANVSYVSFSNAVAHISPIVLSNGNDVFLANITCNNTVGYTSSCVLVENTLKTRTSMLKCTESQSIGGTGCFLASNLGELTLKEIVCIETSGTYSGCINAALISYASLMDVTCDTTSATAFGSCISGIDFLQFTVNGVNVTKNYGGSTGGIHLQANQNANADVSNVYCNGNIGNATGCVAVAKVGGLNVGWVNCVSTEATIAACLITSRVTVVNVNDFTCKYGSGLVSGCYYSASMTGYLTTFNVIGTFGEFAGAVYLINNQYGGDNQIFNSTFENNIMGEFALNFGVGVHLQALIGEFANCQFINNQGPFGGGAVSTSMQGGASFRNCSFIDNSAGKLGGALFHNFGFLILEDCTFENNFADQGGGIGILAPGFLTTISRSQFIDNSASAQGGAIFVSQGNYNISDVICVGNSAKSDGGCLYDGDGSIVCITETNYIQHTNVTNNRAQQGGGLYIHGCLLKMEDVWVSNNTASQTGAGMMIDVSSGFHHLINVNLKQNVAGSSGGAITLTGGNILFDTCLIEQNAAATLAGGVYLAHSPLWRMNVTLDHSVLLGNSAADGGAVGVISSADASYFSWTGPTILYLTNNNITRNTAQINGGGVEILLGSLQMQNNMIDGNTAKGKGGGVFVNEGWVKDRGSMFKKNKAMNGGGMSCDTPLVALMNTSFELNTADNGGGLWLKSCPTLASALVFKQNHANFSGGAAYVEQGGCSFCNNTQCTFKNNGAAFGSDTGTGPQSMKLISVVNNTSVNQVNDIKVVGRLFDAYGHVVTQLQQTVVLSAVVEGNKDVTLTGRFQESFHNGTASLDFFVVPQSSIAHSNEAFDVKLLVQVSGYKFDGSFQVHFTNSVFAPLGWTIGIDAVLGIIGIVSVVITTGLMWLYRDSAIIRGATPPFLVVILFGCFLLSISIIVLPFMPQRAPCQLLPWLLHFSFVFIMAPITGKTWRIYMIFYMASKKFKRFNFTTWRLAIVFIIVPLLVILGYMLAWTFAQKDWTQWKVESSGQNKEYCSLNSIFLAVSLTCGFVLLLWLVRLAVGVKNVPKNFNESFWLGAAIYTLTLIMLFMIPISLISSVPPEIKQVLGGIACWIALEAVLAFLFWRKYYMIWFHADEIKTQKPERSSEESSHGSATESSNMAGSELSSEGGSRSGRSTAGSKTGNTLQRKESNM